MKSPRPTPVRSPGFSRPHTTPVFTATTQFRTKFSISLLLLVLVSASGLSAADTNTPSAAPAPLTPAQIFEGGTNAYNNWLDLSVGGFFTGGNRSQFQQRHQTSNGAFGG